VHAESTVSWLPLARVVVVADARDHLPGIAAIAAPEKRRGLDAAPQVLLAFARSSDQILAARARRLWEKRELPSSLNFFPRSVERRTFMPKKGLQLEA
jgi:hypothetical protein